MRYRCISVLEEYICTQDYTPFGGPAWAPDQNVKYFYSKSSGSPTPRLGVPGPCGPQSLGHWEGFVDWLVDKVIKNCLDMMWRIWESVVGQLKVAAGQLVVAPSRSERTADLLARQEMTRGMTADIMSRFRHHWSQWYTLQNAGSVHGF
jgi:hypothetical protein